VLGVDRPPPTRAILPLRTTKHSIPVLAAVAALGWAIVALPVSSSGAPTASARAPAGFFGIVPQAPLTAEDARYMKAGGIESVRVPMFWSEIQPSARSGYNWATVDRAVLTAVQAGLNVLPSLGTTPAWLAGKATTLPVRNARQRAAWMEFLRAAVRRYGPGGEFWTEHAPGGVGPNYIPVVSRPMPIRTWQIWNEPNFFYFAYPVSPSSYAKLVTISSKAIKQTSPSAKIVLAGLFGNPDESGKRGMDATRFLDALYRSRGIKSRFDAVALHPYAFHVDDLEELTEQVRAVVLAHHDRGAGLYITEMGWGSQNDPNVVAFEQGQHGQVRELRDAYGYLLANRRRLNLKQVSWFSWKDFRGACNFCDSVGLFREGPRFKPKPAWRAFVSLAGGRVRP